RLAYGEATGITQTVRNYAASLGLAILGSIQVSQMRTHVESSLVARGVPRGQAATTASQVAHGRGGGETGPIPHFIRLDFAHAIHAVLVGMSLAMAVAAVVAIVGLRPGVQEEIAGAPEAEPAPA